MGVQKFMQMVLFLVVHSLYIVFMLYRNWALIFVFLSSVTFCNIILGY
jgi:hypothetical protein